jgi:hypothetical protein
MEQISQQMFLTVNFKMRKLIYILITLLFAFAVHTCEGQILRFSTFYTSLTTTAPFIERQTFIVNGVENYGGAGSLIETTRENPPGINLIVGLRKIARFDYQVKPGRFYTGEEHEFSDYATVSNNNGLEYLLEFSRTRNREIAFNQHEYRLRYLSQHYTARGSYVDNNVVGLKYTDAEIRYRKNFGQLDLTAGVAHRSHPVYGYSPIDNWLKNNDDLRDLAYMYGFWDFLLQIPLTENYLAIWYKNVPPHAYDNWDQYENPPLSEFPGVQNVGTNQEFFREEFSKIVERYNRDQISGLGAQHELSVVVGADYYYTADNFWAHTWASMYPLHRGFSEYSFDYSLSKLDWDIGIVVGSKVNTHLGLFLEGRYVRFWEIETYKFRAGINYLIF